MSSTAWRGHPALVNGAGAPVQGLYPEMTESPELRWALIRKIFVILPLQLLLTAIVAAVVVKVRAIPHFFVTSNAGLGLYIFLIIFPFIVLCPLYLYRQKHPVNLLLLGIFTVSICFAVGMTCAFTSVLLHVFFFVSIAASLSVFCFEQLATIRGLYKYVKNYNNKTSTHNCTSGGASRAHHRHWNYQCMAYMILYNF